MERSADDLMVAGSIPASLNYCDGTYIMYWFLVDDGRVWTGLVLIKYLTSASSFNVLCCKKLGLDASVKTGKL